jgi:hypothetical protein
MWRVLLACDETTSKPAGPDGEDTRTGAIDGTVVEEKELTVAAGTFHVVVVTAAGRTWSWSDGVGLVELEFPGEMAALESYSL